MLRSLHSVYTIDDVDRGLVYQIFKYMNQTMDIKIYDSNKKYLRTIENQPIKK